MSMSAWSHYDAEIVATPGFLRDRAYQLRGHINHKHRVIRLVEGSTMRYLVSLGPRTYT